jgi:hypothetical protein
MGWGQCGGASGQGPVDSFQLHCVAGRGSAPPLQCNAMKPIQQLARRTELSSLEPANTLFVPTRTWIEHDLVTIRTP